LSALSIAIPAAATCEPGLESLLSLFPSNPLSLFVFAGLEPAIHAASNQHAQVVPFETKRHGCHGQAMARRREDDFE